MRCLCLQAEADIQNKIDEICKNLTAVIKDKFEEDEFIKHHFKSGNDGVLQRLQKLPIVIETLIGIEIKQRGYSEQLSRMMMERRDAIVDRFQKITYESGIDSDTSLLDEIKSSVLNSPLPGMTGVLGRAAAGVGAPAAMLAAGETVGIVLLGAASAGLSLLYFGYKGFQLYQIASMDVASQVKFLFQNVYLNNDDTSKTALFTCIVQMFADVKKKTHTVFGVRMPEFVKQAQTSLKSICEELKTPEEIDQQYQEINSKLDHLHGKLVETQCCMVQADIDVVEIEETWKTLKKGTFMQWYKPDVPDMECIVVPHTRQRDVKILLEISRRKK